jgi:hypothetical protein
MKHVILAAVVALAVAAPARADLKLTQNVSGKGMGMNGSTVTTTSIKGLKMRSETTSGDTTRTTIFDVENQKLYMFDSKKKEADVWDMADFGQQIGSSVDTSGMTASLKPNGQTKQIAGKTATGYDMSVSMPTRMGDAKSGMQMTVNLSGPTWIVKGAPGTADFQKFYTAAAEKGFIFTDPRAAKAQPGQARATAQMYRDMAATGGVPYETEMNIKMSGEGPMAGMMARMGNISTTSTVQSVEVAPLGDDLFAPPAGYKLNPKK